MESRLDPNLWTAFRKAMADDDLHSVLMLCRQIAKALEQLPPPLSEHESTQMEVFSKSSMAIAIFDKVINSDDYSKFSDEEKDALMPMIMAMVVKGVVG
jgi:hypothetical protein